MNESSTLYWSTLKMYEECPQKFLWSKGWDGVDCGHGPGNRKPNPSDEPKHHAVMGTAIQFAIEKLYNDELYRDPANLTKNLVELAEKEFARQELKPRNRMDYDRTRMTRTEMLDTIRDGVTGYVQTMKHHRFLGPYAKAEVNLLGWVDKWNPVGGIADTIIRRDDTGITIIDGKNTKHKMVYTDPDQLRWYAMLFKLAYKQMPDRLAYVWYRFPFGKTTFNDAGEEVVETGVEWIPFDEDDLRGLAQRALDVKQGMRKHKFDPNPVPKVCRFCDYESVCDARQAQRAANAAKRGRKSKSVDEITEGDGYTDLTL